MHPRRARASIRCAVTITCAALLAGAGPALASDASLTPSSAAVGVTPRYLGFNMGHFRPNSNTAAWTDYAAPNAYRVWASANDYEMADDNTIWGDGVSTFDQFEARKASLRVNPDDNNPATRHINWTTFNGRFDNRTQPGRNHVVLNPMLAALHQRGIEPIMQLTRTKEGYDFSGWEGKWEHWQFYYAMAYHTAKNYDVRRYMIYNEPDQNNSTATPDDYVQRLKFASDAIRSAVADVNRIYGKDLVANVSGPTTKDGASTFNTWGVPALQANRTDYAGRAINYDNFDTYDLHRYNSTGSAFAADIATLNTNVPLHNPSGAAMPVTYTEFNRYNSSTFAGTTDSLDTPAVFTSYAANYIGAMGANVKGMYAFKFSQTWWDPGNGVEEPQKTGHYYVDNDPVYNADPFNVTGSTKGGEVARLITKGFKNERKRLGGTVSSTNSNFDSAFTFDPEKSNYYITTVNRNVAATYVNTINLSAWDVAPGTVVSVEEVSANRHGQVVQYATVPANKTIQITQPGSSVWLVTVPSGPAQTSSDIFASADAYVSGANPSTNFGAALVANVSRSATTADDEVGYLKFELGATNKAKVGRAILWLDGQNVASSDAAILHVYGLLNDAWDESTINWTNAPNLSDADAKIEGVGTDAFIVGSMQFDATQSAFGVDVTEYLRRHGDGVLSLAVAREQRWWKSATDLDADASRIALKTREAGAGAPRLSLLQTANAVHYWDVNASGNFSNGANWDVSSTPDGAGDGVVFGMMPTASRTVTMDAARTLGTVSFNHADTSYTLAGTAVLTIDGGAGTSGAINVYSGQHTIWAPVELMTATTLHADAGAILTVTQGLKSSPAAVGAASVTKTGDGAVRIKNAGELGTLAVNAGTLEVLPNGTPDGMVNVRGLTVADGAILAMNDNDFIVDYSGASPEVMLRDKIKATIDGAAGGISFTQGAGDVVLAVAERTEWGFATFNGVTLDNTAVIGKYTYYGDSNLDGAVTSDDYVAVDVGLGTGDSWVQGDFNFSGSVTSDDYVAIDVNLGKGTPTPLAWAELKAEMIALHTEMFGAEYVEQLAYAQVNGFAATLVPEPSATGVLGGAACAALLRHRRRRRARASGMIGAT